MIDFWKLVRDFNVGDTVQRFAPASGSTLSPFAGRVTAVHRGLGQVDVQWAYGNERMSPDEIVRIDPRLTRYLPPEFDQSYMSYDIAEARKRWASEDGTPWQGSNLPAGFYHELAKVWKQGQSEVGAYDELWHRYAASGVSDESLRSEVQKFYRVSDRLTDLRIQQYVRKNAAYWVAQNRQYRVTQDEVKAGRPLCPRCGAQMRRTTYKMDEGSRIRLFACPKDLFLIKSEAILNSQGEPIGW